MEVIAHPSQLSYFRDVSAGLAKPFGSKHLAPKYLYDTRGSELFEDITGTEEYYLTKTELEIFETQSEEISLSLGLTTPVPLLEFGSGTSEKTKSLLRAWQKNLVGFTPIGIF